MNILASGSEKVKRLQEALGGPVPKEAARKSLASLQRIVQERFNQEKESRAEIAALQAEAQAPLMALIQKDKKAAAAVQKMRNYPVLIPVAKSCPPAPPFSMDASIRAGSYVVVRVPPYDDAFADAFGSADSWVDDPDPGICGFKLGQSAHDRAMNGVGFWFFP